MARSGIEWTESTWNPLTGCTKISPGCKHCYAERMAKRLQAMGQPNYALTPNPSPNEHGRGGRAQESNGRNPLGIRLLVARKSVQAVSIATPSGWREVETNFDV